MNALAYQQTDSELFDGDRTDLCVAVSELRAEVATLREFAEQFIAVIEAHARLHADEVQKGQPPPP